MRPRTRIANRSVSSSGAVAPTAKTTGRCRAEERRGGATNGRLPSIRGARSGCFAGSALPFGPLVRELFPAFVQIDPKGARRSACPQNVQRPRCPISRLWPKQEHVTPSRVNEIYADLDPVTLLRYIRPCMSSWSISPTSRQQAAETDVIVTSPESPQLLDGGTVV